MNSTYAQKSSTVQKMNANTAASVMDSSSQSKSLQRKADMANAAQRAEAPRPNNTGMPDNLKAGIESLSGFSMDNVRVHYNSSKPATVQALAYTQGTDIHVAPGQEKCLPHEAWHVAQQMAGRVSPTTNINGMPVNDNAALEHEADVMGEKAVQCKMVGGESLKNVNAMSDLIQCAGHIESVAIGESQVAKYGKAQIDSSKKGGDSASLYKDDLPHIAFETMANDSRVGELSTLYKRVIKKYKGAASIYMGINACTKYYKQEQDTIWILDKESKNVDLSKVKLNVDREDYHSVIPILFKWNLVGLGKKMTKKFTNEIGANSLKKGEKPEVLKNSEESGCKESISEYTGVAGYVFPFFEARSMIMDKAASSNADFYRWIDSDVSDDSSIEAINDQGYKVFDKEWREHFKRHLDGKQMQSRDDYEKEKKEFLRKADPVLISGFYKWKRNDVSNDKINAKTASSCGGAALPLAQFKENYNRLVDLVNQTEIDFRKSYFKKKNIREEDYGPDVKLDFYFPESTLYMNKKAHDLAKTLSDYASGDESQEREAEAVVNIIGCVNKRGLLVSNDVVVEKPLKNELSTNPDRYSKPLEIIAGLSEKIMYDPIVDEKEFFACLSKLRQCSFMKWKLLDDEGTESSLIKKTKDSLFEKWLKIKKKNYSSVKKWVRP